MNKLTFTKDWVALPSAKTSHKVKWCLKGTLDTKAQLCNSYNLQACWGSIWLVYVTAHLSKGFTSWIASAGWGLGQAADSLSKVNLLEFLYWSLVQTFPWHSELHWIDIYSAYTASLLWFSFPLGVTLLSTYNLLQNQVHLLGRKKLWICHSN